MPPSAAPTGNNFSSINNLVKFYSNNPVKVRSAAQGCERLIDELVIRPWERQSPDWRSQGGLRARAFTISANG